MPFVFNTSATCVRTLPPEVFLGLNPTTKTLMTSRGAEPIPTMGVQK